MLDTIAEPLIGMIESDVDNTNEFFIGTFEPDKITLLQRLPIERRYNVHLDVHRREHSGGRARQSCGAGMKIS